MKPEEIVFLKVSSWRGISIGGVHYYGKLSRYLDYDTSVEVTRTLLSKEAQELNKKDGIEDKFCRYRSRQKTERFNGVNPLIQIAKRNFKKIFPGATILILGDSGRVEPQKVLIGPKDFKNKINKLVEEAEKIDWWENDSKKMQEIWNQWQELWPVKYR